VYRHITLVRWAHALLTVLRAGAMAVEAFKNVYRSPAGAACRLQSRTCLACR